MPLTKPNLYRTDASIANFGYFKKNRINEHSGTIDQTEVALLLNSKARENVHKIFEIYH